MSFYENTSYKTVLRERVKSLRREDPSLSLRRLAEVGRIQYTYLSRVLNSDDIHLSDDVLFEMARFLRYSAEQIDFLLLLKASHSATSSHRRADAEAKLAAVREARKIDAVVRSGEPVDREISYLLDPYCVLVHISLYVTRYRQDLESLALDLGLSRPRLDEILAKLAAAGFISFDPERAHVSELHAERLHYDTTHPLIRAHQTLLRLAAGARMLNLEEERRLSFVAAFTGDEATLAAVKGEFNSFIGRIQKLSEQAKEACPYYLQFDFFRWT